MKRGGGEKNPAIPMIHSVVVRALRVSHVVESFQWYLDGGAGHEAVQR
ncbi:hypothetical protein GS745_26550 [Rhodococcus hoagii]|nr:hypothetical protein [Prescottella equi]